MVPDVAPGPGPRQGRGERLTLGVRVLHDERPAGPQQDRGASGHGQRHAQPVLAVAVERHVGIVLAHLGVDGHHPDGDVRRVGHDHVDPSIQLGQHLRRGRVAQHELHAQPGRGHVARRPGVRLGSQLRGIHTARRHLVGDGERDGARPGAQVDHDRSLPRRPRRLDGQPGHHLGLGPRHEDPRPHRELEPAEAGAAGEVLQRHPVGAFGNQCLVCRGRRCPEHHRLADVPDRAAQRVGGQRHGVGLGGGDAGLGQPSSRHPDGVAQARLAHLPSATAARRDASSASTADWSTGSSSPSSTVSRL
jgi:hypothetical protein